MTAEALSLWRAPGQVPTSPSLNPDLIIVFMWSIKRVYNYETLLRFLARSISLKENVA